MEHTEKPVIKAPGAKAPGAKAPGAKAKPKAKIPKALREQVWRTYNENRYEAKCAVSWCTNKITVFNFEVGHNIPESKGGDLQLHNLRPICSRCNSSMGNKYTIDQWNTITATPSVCCSRCF